MKHAFHHSRVSMGAITSAGMLATAVVSDQIHNPKLRMLCMAGMAALLSIVREVSYHRRDEGFADRAQRTEAVRSR
jgi:hypothetical protein